MKKSAGKPQSEPEKDPKQGITNHDLGEEKARQAKVIPFRQPKDKEEADGKTK